MVPAAGNFHAVRFYRDAHDLGATVAAYVAEGFTLGQPAVVIATPPHVDQIREQLRARGLSSEQLARDDRLVLLDAEETLAQLLLGVMPDPIQFRRTIVPVIEGASAANDGARVRAYGEMVDVLWKADRTRAASRLERLWNSLAHTHTFSLLCGYATDTSYKLAAVDEICSHHSHVVTDDADAATIA